MNDQLNKLHFVPKGTLTFHGKIVTINILFLTEQIRWVTWQTKIDLGIKMTNSIHKNIIYFIP